MENKIYNTEERIIGITSKCAYCNAYMIKDERGQYCEKQCDGVKEEERLLEEIDKAQFNYKKHKLNVGNKYEHRG